MKRGPIRAQTTKNVGISINDFVKLMNDKGETNINLLQGDYKKQLKEVLQQVDNKLELFKEPDEIKKFNKHMEVVEAEAKQEAVSLKVAKYTKDPDALETDEDEPMSAREQTHIDQNPIEKLKRTITRKMTKKDTINLIRLQQEIKRDTALKDQVQVTVGFRAQYIEKNHIALVNDEMEPLEEAKMKVEFLLNKLSYVQEEHKRDLATYELRLQTRVQEYASKAVAQL
jgi:hypothetical protein